MEVLTSQLEVVLDTLEGKREQRHWADKPKATVEASQEATEARS
jgi:hypothetical protein